MQIDLEKTNMKNLVMYVCRQKIIRNKAKLETADSAKTIATLQGELEGMKELVGSMVHHMGIAMPSIEMEFSYSTEELAGPVIDWNSADDEIISIVHSQVLFDEEMDTWQEVDDYVSRRLEEKKTYLFYQADKSQDLFKVHGFREGITTHKTLFETIRHEKRQREDKNPLFTSFE